MSVAENLGIYNFGLIPGHWQKASSQLELCH